MFYQMIIDYTKFHCVHTHPFIVIIPLFKHLKISIHFTKFILNTMSPVCCWYCNNNKNNLFKILVTLSILSLATRPPFKYLGYVIQRFLLSTLRIDILSSKHPILDFMSAVGSN